MTRFAWLALATVTVAAETLPAQFNTPPLVVPGPGDVATPSMRMGPAPQCCHCSGSCACQQSWWCRSALGHLFRSMLAPTRILSGHTIPHCCADALLCQVPALTPETPLPVAAATKIRADEAGADLRRAAVRYLGTVDCHYYPEAEEALIAALRADRNECVRLEAAMALGNGCCWTPKVIQKLHLAVSGGDSDGNPAENSERVKMAALASLQKCLAEQDSMLVTPDQDQGVPAPKELPVEITPSIRQGKAEPAEFVLQPVVQNTPLEPDTVVFQAQQTVAAYLGAIPPRSSARRTALSLLQASFSPGQNSPRTSKTSAESYSAEPPWPSLSNMGLDPIGRIPPSLP